MDTRSTQARITALFAAAAVAMVGLAMISVAHASAEDVFRFNNDTGKGFTGFLNPEPECWFGASGVLKGASEPLQSGVIRAEVGLFEGCGEFWGAILSYDQTFWESYESGGETHYFWKGGVSAFYFAAEDPELGPATLSCSAVGREWTRMKEQEEEGREIVPIETEMASEVDGTTCTVEWLPGASASGLARSAAVEPGGAKYTRFVDSLAPVDAGKARVTVQAFGRPGLQVADAIVLRTLKGQPIGRATTRLQVGDKPKRVAVHLSPAARKALAHRGYLKVKASIAHVDGSKGDGDSTSQLVLRRSTPSQ